MIVPYTEFPHDADGVARPLLEVALADMPEMPTRALVDSGAMHTLLPAWMAEAAGIGLRRAPTRLLALGGTSTEAAFVPTRLTVGGHTWEAEVGFCRHWPFKWAILGQASFFRYFTVTFRAADFELEVTPNRV